MKGTEEFYKTSITGDFRKDNGDIYSFTTMQKALNGTSFNLIINSINRTTYSIISKGEKILLTIGSTEYEVISHEFMDEKMIVTILGLTDPPKQEIFRFQLAQE